MYNTKNKPLRTDVSQQTPPSLPLSGEEKGSLPLIRGIKGVCTTNGTKGGKHGFTLVELIVVITIVAILGTLAFTQMGSFQKDARDSKRITNISTIAGAFDINMAAGKLINTSETSTGYNIIITGSTFTMTGYYGQVNNTLLNSLKVYSKDITTTTDYPYSYSYFPTEKKYQVSSFLENSSNLPTAAYLGDHIINQTYADTTSTGYVYIKGNFSATGGINSLIPDTTAWTTATPNPDGTKTIPGSSTTVPGTTASAPPIIPTTIDGECGTASKTYSYTDTTFGSDTFCTAGTSNPTIPTFPTEGSPVTWTCEGGGTPAGTQASCTATRQSPANCIAGPYTKNTHTYAVPQLNHNATGSVISNPPTAIANGTQTFTMIYGCSNGTVYEVSTEGANTPVCNANYNWNGSICTANTQTYTCTAKPVTGTLWNTVGSYTQTWNGTAWLPANSTTTYNTTASTTTCNYKCDTGYNWNGTSCISCPSGYSFISARNRCETAPTCTTGTYNPTTDKCESTSTNTYAASLNGGIVFNKIVAAYDSYNNDHCSQGYIQSDQGYLSYGIGCVGWDNRAQYYVSATPFLGSIDLSSIVGTSAYTYPSFFSNSVPISLGDDGGPVWGLCGNCLGNAYISTISQTIGGTYSCSSGDTLSETTCTHTTLTQTTPTCASSGILDGVNNVCYVN
ncbi:MAG: type II secretion system protein [Candidatus Gracilibacteria bacterium]|nr:type II secretion system protein [Candidatus Gracilibacteria bacterium]